MESITCFLFAYFPTPFKTLHADAEPYASSSSSDAYTSEASSNVTVEGPNFLDKGVLTKYLKTKPQLPELLDTSNRSFLLPFCTDPFFLNYGPCIGPKSELNQPVPFMYDNLISAFGDKINLCNKFLDYDRETIR